MPVVFALIAWVVAPLLQLYDNPAPADNTALSPVQKVVAPVTVTVAAGNGFTVTTVAVDDAVQPEAFVTVTV